MLLVVLPATLEGLRWVPARSIVAAAGLAAAESLASSLATSPPCLPVIHPRQLFCLVRVVRVGQVLDQRRRLLALEDRIGCTGLGLLPTDRPSSASSRSLA
jgi:hypothetical protein